MKKAILAIVFGLISTIVFGQDNAKKVIKISYKSVPVSQYCISKSEMVSRPNRGSNLDMLNGYKTYYSLLVNLENRASIYSFDSIVTTKVVGRESDNVSIADEIRFCYKPAGNTTYKYELIMGQQFKTKGTVGDIEWVITDEKKKVLGFDCTKAISKNKDLMMTVWFTSSIPVSSGPAIYMGLPGLVIWAEDFFRTTQVEKIEYSNDVPGFNTKLKKLHTDFIKQNKDLVKEPILIIKKAELGKHFFKLIQADDQK